jgi:nitrous oxidase accessory protein
MDGPFAYRSLGYRTFPSVLSILLCWPLVAAAGDPPSFQALVDAAEPNATLQPPPGTYAGPVVLDKPLTIDGRGQVTIDAGGHGTVLLLDTDGATIKNLHLTGSGSSHDDIDAGVQVRGNFNVVKDNRIDDCLFGIDLQQSSNNLVKHNRISSKAVDLGLRGDAIRLWYSFHNKVIENEFFDSRDMVVWYSRDNVLSGNKGTRGRYSMHFMYSQYNLVENNEFRHNSVSIFLMYSDGIVLRGNVITHATGPTGMGIGWKETSDVTVENNEVLYNAKGLYFDLSPFQPDTTNRITGNLIAYNGVGIEFHDDTKYGNIFKNNVFKGNVTQVMGHARARAVKNTWEGNHWDDFEGFDRDKDGIGDSPYELYAYADRLWMDVPSARFFKGSPVLEVLDFLERLAPFTGPDLMLRDLRPILTTAATTREAAATEAESENAAQAEQGGLESGKPSALDLLKQSLRRP